MGFDGDWCPAADAYETDQEFVIKVDVPEMDPKDLEIRIEDRTLMLRGERKSEEEVKEDNFYRVERSCGSFARSFTLPESTDTDKVSAKYDKGVLKVTVPKVESKPKAAKTVKVH